MQSQYDRDKAKFDRRFPRAAPPENRQDDNLALAQTEKLAEKRSSDTLNQSDQQAQDFRKGEEDLERANTATTSNSGSDVSSAETESSSDDREGDIRDTRVTLSRTTTRQSLGVDMGRLMTGIKVRTRNANDGGEGKVFIVGFEGPDDPLNPHNWSYLTRWRATINIVFIGCIVGFASSVDSGALEQAAREFGVSEVVESLATGLFLIGFGFGALTAGPLSEEFGRNPIYIGTMALYCVFIMASALAPNIGAQLAFRFIAGWFGATPLSCAGGSVSDLWDSTERVFVFPLFANGAFMGPILGPLVGSFIGQSHLSWRWCEWVTLIVSGAVLTAVTLFQPETYPPTLLRWRAKHLREITGDNRFKAEVEIRGEKFTKRFKRAMYRPFLILFQEPIALLFGLYLTVIYIILFTFLDGYTYIFGETYGFSQGSTGLTFLGIAIGLCLASPLIYPIYVKYKRALIKAEKQGKAGLPPEQRLWFMMIGGPAIPLSMFWMGWTAFPSVSYWSPLVASVFFGFGILCVFISSYQYLIDTYDLYAASALAAVALVSTWSDAPSSAYTTMTFR